MKKKLQLETPEPKRKVLGQAGPYVIRKYGLYQYQVYKLDPITHEESKIGIENVYPVVAGDLIDLMFSDICRGMK